jgi:hypothetical protein
MLALLPFFLFLTGKDDPAGITKTKLGLQKDKCPHKNVEDILTAGAGVCSIFLRVDINEIHKPRALYSIEVFHEMYVVIYY